MNLTRRGALAALPAWAMSAGAARAQAAPRLPVPPLLEAAAGGSIELLAAAGSTEFWPGRPSATAGYNGSFLGPTLRARRGADLRVRVRNALAEATTVHWHGLLVPSEVDGGPHNAIAPGGDWSVVLPVRQPAATLWYHAHPHLRTGPQVYQGLAGLLLVDDDADRALGLPSEYGVDDLPVILQDRVFDARGRMVYPRDPMTRMLGVTGDVLLTNGAVSPTARVPRGWVRLRLLNAANARTFVLAFAGGRAFHWIATDGGLLRAPVPMRRLALSPGQRTEILLDLSDGVPAQLQEQSEGGAHAVLRLEPAGGRRAAATLPPALAAWEAPGAPAQERRLTLEMGMGGMGGMGNGAMRIDGRPFDMERIDQRVRLGAVERWRIVNQPMMMMDVPHPFHIHGVRFQVVARDGRPAGALDQGWRDTVLVSGSVDVVAQFTQPARTLPFMYHCHILEHEDLGMMGQFSVA